MAKKVPKLETTGLGDPVELREGECDMGNA